MQRLAFEQPSLDAEVVHDRYEEFAQRPGLDAGWLGSLPTSGAGQRCAFCDSSPVRWIQALDPALVQYRVYGKGHTLPTFWTLCDRCEQLYQAGDEETVVSVMLANSTQWSFRIKRAEDVYEHVRQPLAVFGRADLGPRALTGRPPVAMTARIRRSACGRWLVWPNSSGHSR